MNIKRWTGEVKSRNSEVNDMEAIAIRQDVKKATKRPYNISNAIKAKNNNIDTFEKMIQAGEAFKKALGISDDEIYDLLRKRG